MPKYLVVHCKHDGCYDFKYYEDDITKTRLSTLRINPPKVFCFETKEQASDFFEDYINDVDVIDVRCRKGDEEVDHKDYCTCGVIEMDDDGDPNLFYNKRNQIFLLESGAQVFLPSQDLKEEIINMNLTNKLIRKSKTLAREQQKKYVELGRICQDCLENSTSDSDSDNENDKKSKSKVESKPAPAPAPAPTPTPTPAPTPAPTPQPEVKETKKVTKPKEPKKEKEPKEPKKTKKAAANVVLSSQEN